MLKRASACICSHGRINAITLLKLAGRRFPVGRRAAPPPRNPRHGPEELASRSTVCLVDALRPALKNHCRPSRFSKAAKARYKRRSFPPIKRMTEKLKQ
jgi:hypothetical protein